MDAQKKAAQERARHKNGQYGNQYHAEAEGELSPADEAEAEQIWDDFLGPFTNDDPVSQLMQAASTYKDAETLSRLAEHEDPWVRQNVAANESSPPKVLAVLAEDANDTVRDCVARNRSTTVETLSSLSKDSVDYIRESVAGNRSTSPSTLDAMARKNTQNYYEVSPICTNPATSPETLDWLSRNKPSDYQLALIARNHNASTKTLLAIASGGHDRLTMSEQVRKLARDNNNFSLAGETWRRKYDEAMWTMNAYFSYDDSGLIRGDDGQPVLREGGSSADRRMVEAIKKEGVSRGWL